MVEGSRGEPGCLHYELMSDNANPCKFATYEVFESAEAVAAHMEADYVKAWGAFQYGDKQPVVSKEVMKGDLELILAPAL